MCEKKKKVIENLLTKTGCKYKAEVFLKRAVKNLQKTEKKRESLGFFKIAIIKSADSQVVSRQVIKRGKRKKFVESAITLVSEKARFSNAWKNVVSNFKNSGKSPISKAISDILVRPTILDTSTPPVESDNGLKKTVSAVSNKFRW